MSEHRWSKQADKILRKAGWHPGRVAEPGENALRGSGGRIPQSVTAFLSEFGGLEVHFPEHIIWGMAITGYDVGLWSPPPSANVAEMKLLSEFEGLKPYEAIKLFVPIFCLIGDVPTGDADYLMDDAGCIYLCGLRATGGAPMDLYRLGIENLCLGHRALKKRVKLANRSDFDRIFKEMRIEGPL